MFRNWTAVAIFALSLVPQAAIAAGTPRTCAEVFVSRPSMFTYAKTAGLWALTTGAALMPMAAMAGGFSGSGGGGGVARFLSPEEANFARKFQSEGQPLPPELLQKSRLQVLERWEMEKKGMTPFAVRPGAEWPEIYAQARANLERVSPIIVRRMDMVSDWMTFADWEGARSLPRLEDANPSAPLGSTDVPVQLALRFSEGNNQYGQGPTLGSVKLKVVFNREAFDQLEPFDQAMLVVHEELYALAQATGHPTSDFIRPLVQLLFSQQLVDKAPDGVFEPRFAIEFKNRILLKTFGDYPMYFADLDVPPKGKVGSAERSFYIFVKILKELRQNMHECLARKIAGPQCAEISMVNFMGKPEVSGEEAFTFLSYFYLEKQLLGINAELMMDVKASPQETTKELDKACKMLYAHQNLFVKMLTPLGRALEYCRALR